MGGCYEQWIRRIYDDTDADAGSFCWGEGAGGAGDHGGTGKADFWRECPDSGGASCRRAVCGEDWSDQFTDDPAVRRGNAEKDGGFFGECPGKCQDKGSGRGGRPAHRRRKGTEKFWWRGREGLSGNLQKAGQ